ncbi:MAG: LPS export ABC transporter permease LptF [Gammaproteobacteria bacterium]
MIIDRYISREIFRLFFGGLGMLIVVFIGYSAARQLSLAAEGQLGMSAALALAGLNTLIMLEVLLPSALFFSILAAIGRMHRDGEMPVLYATGVSPARILGSVAKLSLLIALITGFISTAGRPWAYRESYRIEAEAAARFDLSKVASGRFVTLGNKYFTTFIADGLDLDQGLHKEVFLQRNYQGERRRSEIIVAEAAALLELNPGQTVTGKFFNGYYYLLDNRKQQDVTLRFKELAITVPFEEAQADYQRKAKSTGDLADSRNPKDIAEFQWRISTPLATLLLALTAVPLARSKPRESGFRIFIVAIALYVGVFSMAAVARTWLEHGKIDSVPGLWIVYLVLGLVLLALLKPRG